MDEEKKERFKAMCFLLRASVSKYSELFDDLRKGVFCGCDEYPKTVASAYELQLTTSKQLG